MNKENGEIKSNISQTDDLLLFVNKAVSNPEYKYAESGLASEIFVTDFNASVLRLLYNKNKYPDDFKDKFRSYSEFSDDFAKKGTIDQEKDLMNFIKKGLHNKAARALVDAKIAPNIHFARGMVSILYNNRRFENE